MKKVKLWIPLLIGLISLWGCKKEIFMNEEGNLVPKTVERDPTLPSIAVNGTMLHSETFGNPDSAMIVVLHGGPGSDYRHLLNCKELAAHGYYVVFYDQRGSGLSKRHSKSSYSIQVMLDDVSAVIAHYRKSPAQKIFLLGHSWGAILATAYIDKYPTAVRGAILAEPGGFTWEDIDGYVSRSRDIKITSELISDFLYADQFITGKKKDEHAVLDYKYALLSGTDDYKDNPIGNEGPLPFWRSGAIVNQALFELGDKEKPDWTTHLNQFTTKILFVYSERNRAYGQTYAQKVSSAYPNVQLFKVNGAGHDMLSFP
ncbi:MAG TPA: alpha/beta hydrolase, partial [Chitinophagaceae bacterium]|nr:alpha/beta hydrolase [Chitinophagaceae bacterium]